MHVNYPDAILIALILFGVWLTQRIVFGLLKRSKYMQGDIGPIEAMSKKTLKELEPEQPRALIKKQKRNGYRPHRQHNVSARQAKIICMRVSACNRAKEYSRDPEHCALGGVYVHG